MKTDLIRVVIVGGGFGGLAVAKSLSKTSNIKVTLVDKKNYHLFQPLLYQVAMAGLSPAEIAYPLRSILGACPNVEVLLGEVKEINKEEKWIKTEANQINFDYLVLACGSTYTYFGSEQWEKFAPGLKTIPQATEIRRKVFLAFEKAERATDEKTKELNTTFVIVGGGPTGVELAGTLGEITRYSINKEFENIKPLSAKIILIEMAPQILPSMPKELQEDAIKQLNELGVEVRTNIKVTDINDEGITAGGEFIPSGTVLWAAGVAANPLNKALGVELDRKGQVMVERDFSLPGHPSIFVIGDQAHYEWGEEGKPLPGLAPVAMQEGRFVAKYIKKKVNGGVVPTFKYVDKGQMATIGRSRAIVDYKGIHLSGFTAWMAWLLVHIYYLIGFKNRVLVLFLWAWTYFTHRRGSRLIIEKEPPLIEQKQ